MLRVSSVSRTPVLTVSVNIKRSMQDVGRIVSTDVCSVCVQPNHSIQGSYVMAVQCKKCRTNRIATEPIEPTSYAVKRTLTSGTTSVVNQNTFSK